MTPPENAAAITASAVADREPTTAARVRECDCVEPDCTLVHPRQPSAYDRERDQWVPKCPHGDICTGCDAQGYCERGRAASAVRERVRCRECGKRRVAVVWLDLGNYTCAALCGACAKEAEARV